ncbi:hypothetical protein BKA70DRAFT_1267554 [Coprinopsis sp. MPI-PUGE-AT-0042]|nr:hypothetical protein BKA70DRAFT_1267554 [Coprinopsis sp. MPI-PUGE-AT-0042]
MISTTTGNRIPVMSALNSQLIRSAVRILDFTRCRGRLQDEVAFGREKEGGSRWVTGQLFKRAKAGHSHLNAHKSAEQKNRLSGTAYANATQAARLRKKLLPYGSS